MNKRQSNAGENNGLQFVDMSGPPKKRQRRVAQPITEVTQAEARRVWEERQRADTVAQAEFNAAHEREEEAERRATSKTRIGQVLQSIKEAGYSSLYNLLDDLVTTKDQHHSSQVSQMLVHHGEELLDPIRLRQPEIVAQWIKRVAGDILAEEGAKLAQHLRPPQGQSVTKTLENFSLKRILADAEFIAPTICHLLGMVTIGDSSDTTESGRKDKKLVLTTVLCMLAQTANQKSSEYQTTMGFYLLACGASHSQFDVLNHAGLCLSYRSDNLNFAFRVTQQRIGSNDHFDNGTTATLVVLWGLLPPHKTRLPVLKFRSESDLLPTLEDVQNLEALHRWHIEEILLEEYPMLRTRFADSISDPPSVLLIPLHITDHLDGTIDALKLTGKDIQRHGVLSASLFDKVAASRRDDVDLLDNLGRYGKEQMVNEHWGSPNSKALWSLWKVNSLLGRKSMTAGWKAKKLPPFRPSYELMIDLALPANILDGFRLFCPAETVDKWVDSVKDWDSVRAVAAKVHRELCSAHDIPKLRRQPAAKRDPIYENIKLFSRDALTLLVLRAAVKRGDIGAVLCVSAHWMVMFHGTGRMPKYADAVFRVITELKSMHPKLRCELNLFLPLYVTLTCFSEAYLMNWLANLSGKLLGFKEIDLLQEHQNFCLKTILTDNLVKCELFQISATPGTSSAV
ncbi:hypothetical protein B0H13DRAFT_2233006 [Mycena leptocephala]|nr:hypothetical protein B0H13DRAFT_2233006 [Mycena leptocephala]